MNKINIWKIKKDEIVTPDDIKFGRIDGGCAGAVAVSQDVYTVPCQELPNGSHCAVRVDLETCRRLMNEETFTVESSGWWISFGKKSIVALRHQNGDVFNHIKGFME